MCAGPMPHGLPYAKAAVAPRTPFAPMHTLGTTKLQFELEEPETSTEAWRDNFGYYIYRLTGGRIIL